MSLERSLLDTPILHLYRNSGRGGGHPSYVAVLLGGGCAVMKTEDEVGNGSTMIRNERAAWVLAYQIGFADLLAVTVIRRLPSPRDRSRMIEASLQVAWPNCEAPPAAEPLERVDPYDLRRAAIFDYLIQASDRSGNNWLTLSSTDPVQLKLIDHGHAFGSPGSVSSDLYKWVKDRGDTPIPTETREALVEWLQNWPPVELPDLLVPERLAEVADRAFQLVVSGKL